MLTQSPAFRDREAGSASNRSKPVDDGARPERHSERGGRGGRGNSHGGRGAPGDRHTRGLPK